jgi:Zn-dependent M28 family amino/carboxypeptidase
VSASPKHSGSAIALRPSLRVAAAILLATTSALARSQGPAPSGPAADSALAEAIERIYAEALARPGAHARLQDLCRLAPHRLSGSADAANAVEWAVAAMESLGLDSVRKEECMVPRWERGRVASLEVVAPSEAQNTFLPILALGGSVGTVSGTDANSATAAAGAELQGDLVVVRAFEELAALGDGARGKIVLFDRPMDPRKTDPFEAYGGAVDQRSRGAVEAARHGAIAAVVRSMTLRLDDIPHTGAMRYEDGVKRVPGVAVSTAGAERLAALARSGQRVRLALRLDCADRGEVLSHNVVGEIRGTTRADEIVVLGAHLDGWDVGQGAHDDGAGVVHVLEALRLLKVLDLRPERTLRGVLFMNEENGLRGALAYRETHAAELARHVLAIESDRGGFVPRGFGTNAEGDTFAALRSIADLLEPAGASQLRRSGGGADVSVLTRNGVPVMELLTDPQRYFDVHHCSRDTLDTVHPRELELGAAALAAMACGAAQSGDRLSRSPATHR